MEPIIGQPTADATSDLVKESDSQNFKSDVVDASMSGPVIVDFWAPWCQPCKKLGPVLEKAVRAARGKVKLVKIDIDKSPDLAQLFRVQSIPFVFAFRDGQPVDGFPGAPPESQITAFIEKIVGATPASPVAQALQQAKTALDENELGAADTLYRQILRHESDNVEASAGLARCHVAANDLKRAKDILDRIGEANAKHVDVSSARAALSLAEHAVGAGNVGDLETRLARDSNDHQARLDLAMALYASGAREAMVDQLLELFRRDREWNHQAARVQLVKLFEAFGPRDNLTVSGRKRLSALMFA